MRVEQQPGFILHARAWRETSLLLEVLSRDHGRVGVVARGVRGARTRVPRSVLQPLALLSLSWTGQGELALLTAAEVDTAWFALAGESLLCGLYLNELVARLLPRNDPHPELFKCYGRTLQRLHGADAPSWHLRRFERDLLADLGYGMVLEQDAESGELIDPEGAYAYRFDAGPARWRDAGDGLKISGAALLALAADNEPSSDDLSTLRRLMRGLIAHHLAGAGLQAWGLFGAAHPRT